MPIEETIALIKPHAMKEYGWPDLILAQYRKKDLEIKVRKHLLLTPETAREFYLAHKDESFFPGLIESMCEDEVLALLLRGENAIQKVRDLNGATDPAKAERDTIRYMFRGPGGPHNTVHGSDSVEAALRERKIIFGY